MELTDRQHDLLSAALRHQRDAESLLVSSPDQAWHLAGYGPECARKATLGPRTFDKAIGHDLATAATEDLAFVLDPMALRYRVPPAPLAASWKVADRYRRTGSIPKANAETLVAQTSTIVSTISAGLWLDGRVQESEL